MYEKFSDRARRVMQIANQEAQRFNHEYIGTEHVLLGLVKEGRGVAANVLKNLDVDLQKARLEVEKLVQSGPEIGALGKLPTTPRTKKVIEYAMEESRNLNHNYVGTEHLLLGMLREQEGIAAQVLMTWGIDADCVRKEINSLLGGDEPQDRHEGPALSHVDIDYSSYIVNLVEQRSALWCDVYSQHCDHPDAAKGLARAAVEAFDEQFGFGIGFVRSP